MLIDRSRDIKNALLAARKARDSTATASLSTLLGEIETLAKAGKGDLTDGAVVAVVKKFVKNINDTIAMLPVDNQAEPFDSLIKEKALYEQFLPKQLSIDDLTALINGMIKDGVLDVGEAMKRLKAEHAGAYNGADASAILKEKFKK